MGSQMYRKIFFLVGIILAAICIYYLYFYLHGASNPDAREANLDELDYAGIATTGGYADMCYKIYGNAITNGAGFSTEGFQISYLRSECLFIVAYNTNNPDLCTDEIKPYSTTFLDGGKYTKEECFLEVNEKIQKNHDTHRSVGPGSDPQTILQKMGYTQTMIPQKMKDGNGGDAAFYWIEYYYSIIHTKDFEERLQSLPAYTR